MRQPLLAACERQRLLIASIDMARSSFSLAALASASAFLAAAACCCAGVKAGLGNAAQAALLPAADRGPGFQHRVRTPVHRGRLSQQPFEGK